MSIGAPGPTPPPTSAPPVAITEAATAVATNSATFNASVNPEGGATSVSFQYGIDPTLSSGVIQTSANAVR